MGWPEGDRRPFWGRRRNDPNLPEHMATACNRSPCTLPVHSIERRSRQSGPAGPEATSWLAPLDTDLGWPSVTDLAPTSRTRLGRRLRALLDFCWSAELTLEKGGRAVGSLLVRRAEVETRASRGPQGRRALAHPRQESLACQRLEPWAHPRQRANEAPDDLNGTPEESEHKPWAVSVGAPTHASVGAPAHAIVGEPTPRRLAR